MRIDAVIVTCEHGGNQVPAGFAEVFRPHQSLLDSHRGHDPGALPLARQFARALDAPLFYSRTTRLLVDLNRSLHNRSIFSAVSRTLPADQRQGVLEAYYFPYRQAVESAVADALRRVRGNILHLSIHSFTPVLDGCQRNADVGFLYDPGRPGERRFCSTWMRALKGRMPALRLRRNYPYRGTADGFTTYLRRAVRSPRYLGVELEVSQRYPKGEPAEWKELRRALVRSAVNALERLPAGVKD